MNIFQDGVNWEILREESDGWRHLTTASQPVVEIKGLSGSIWGTEEFRRRVFQSDEPLVRNMFLLQSMDNNERSLARFSLSTTFVPEKRGAQAGILLYHDDLNYIKLVIEGNTDGSTMIILAVQEAGAAEVVAMKSEMKNSTDTPMLLSFEKNETNNSKYVAKLNHEPLLSENGEVAHFNIPSLKPLKPAFMAHSFEGVSSPHASEWARFSDPELIFSD